MNRKDSRGHRVRSTSGAPGGAQGSSVHVNGSIATGSLWHYGLARSVDTGAVGADAAAPPSFSAGSRAFALGAWSLPRTVFPHHIDQALLSYEDPLQLSHGLGMRLGVTATPSSARANASGISNAVLPSRSSIFPMDDAYALPPSDEVYRGDVTVQRRMLIARKFLGMSAPGLSWEAHAGSGLVEGVGAGIAHDGRGWEDIGLMAGSDVLPFDGEPESASTGGVVAALLRATSVHGSGDPAGGAGSKRARDVDDDDESAAAARAQPAPFDVLLRARIGRGCRLLVDRIPAAAEDSLLPRVAAAATQLALRKRARMDAQSHAWSALTSSKASLPGSSRGVDLSFVSSQERIRVGPGDVDVPSTLHLRRLYGLSGDVTDSGALHVHALHKYGAATGSGEAVDADTLQITKRGLSTALLAESCYSRVGAMSSAEAMSEQLLGVSAQEEAAESAELASFLSSVVPEAAKGDSKLATFAALEARLTAALTAANKSDAANNVGSNLSHLQQRAPAPHPLALGASGSKGWVPRHAVTASAAKIFGGPKPFNPRQHDTFIEASRTSGVGSAARSSGSHDEYSGSAAEGDDAGLWHAAEPLAVQLAAGACIPPQRFTELWALDDSDNEDLVSAMYSGAPRVAGFERIARAAFTESQTKLLLTTVPLEGT